MEQHYENRLLRHASDIRQMAERHRTDGVIDSYSKHDMYLVARAGKDIWLAFRNGFFGNPAFGRVLGKFAAFNIDIVAECDGGTIASDEFCKLVRQDLVRYWYSLRLSSPIRVELDEQDRVTKDAALARFVEETIDLAEAIEFFVTEGRSLPGTTDVNAVLREAISHDDREDSYGELLAAVCAAACIDSKYQPIIDAILDADYPYHEDALKKHAVREEIREYLTTASEAFAHSDGAQRSNQSKSADEKIGKGMDAINRFAKLVETMDGRDGRLGRYLVSCGEKTVSFEDLVEADDPLGGKRVFARRKDGRPLGNENIARALRDFRKKTKGTGVVWNPSVADFVVRRQIILDNP